MTRVLYFDASAGVSGDMFVGALLDLGASLDAVAAHVAALGVPGIELRAQKVARRGIAATKFEVLDPESRTPVDEAYEADHHAHPHHRGLSEIRDLLRQSPLPREVSENALAVFERLAAAEGKVHAVEPNEVHFHEVGALDAIADIVAASSAFAQIHPDRALCSPVHVGCGTVRCAHGLLPVPAPATRELLRDVPFYSDGTRGELATPTGAALLRHFCAEFGPMPSLAVDGAGCGAGTRDFGFPNVLRVVLGRVANGARLSPAPRGQSS